MPPRSKILLLGSLPGDRSLQENQYYAHPQNRFWKILALLLGATPPLNYPHCIALLHKYHIALWDVCEVAIRKGSMDTNILQERPNQIADLLRENPSINSVCFNGQKAQKLYDKYFERTDGIQYITLPSTSPANATFNQERLLAAWSVIREIVNTA